MTLSLGFRFWLFRPAGHLLPCIHSLYFNIYRQSWNKVSARYSELFIPGLLLFFKFLFSLSFIFFSFPTNNFRLKKHKKKIKQICSMLINILWNVDLAENNSIEFNALRDMHIRVWRGNPTLDFR